MPDTDFLTRDEWAMVVHALQVSALQLPEYSELSLQYDALANKIEEATK